MKRVHLPTVAGPAFPDGFWLYNEPHYLPAPIFTIPKNEVLVSASVKGHTVMVTTRYIGDLDSELKGE